MTITPTIIRGGNTVFDPRLDRIYEPDDRNKDFPILAALEDEAPEEPKLRLWSCCSWFDQGREGACVAFGIGHELAAVPVEVKQPLSDQWLTQEIYWEAQKIDPWEGGAYPGARPYYSGTSVLAGVKIAHSKGYFREYRWADTVEEMARGISEEGPCVIGVPWHRGMMTPDEYGFIHVDDDPMGGHCVCVRGVFPKQRVFLIRNSWNMSWGLNGECFITYEDMATLLADNGEAVFFVGRVDPENPVDSSRHTNAA